METTQNILTFKNTIDGIWINNDKNTKKIAKVIISNNGKNVQVFDKYGSNDSDWGVKVLTPETNSTDMYWTIFYSRLVKSIFIFTINRNIMEVRYEQDYKSSSKETESFVENFTKQDECLNESIDTTTSVKNRILSTRQSEEMFPEQLDHAPVLFTDDLVSDHNLKTFKGSTVVTEEAIYPISKTKPKGFSYLRRAYHFNYGKDYGLRKRLLSVFAFIGSIINKVGHAISTRRLTSLISTASQHTNSL
ncbi:hypothetical protein [Flavivirga eckloniae]|uniref:Uncharacterized protein n=1 Tax=Flavivirga eckloniae TaxID=1803846 RepID=A0A2K9PL82_9FLAO|nr:hypothetical protein [Flavivirga eckloniae]AUP77598.1 hypothetical protein C1H87_02240 [Flavivirga eckloniae]